MDYGTLQIADLAELTKESVGASVLALLSGLLADVKSKQNSQYYQMLRLRTPYPLCIAKKLFRAIRKGRIDRARRERQLSSDRHDVITAAIDAAKNYCFEPTLNILDERIEELKQIIEIREEEGFMHLIWKYVDPDFDEYIRLGELRDEVILLILALRLVTLGGENP